MSLTSVSLNRLHFSTADPSIAHIVGTFGLKDGGSATSSSSSGNSYQGLIISNMADTFENRSGRFCHNTQCLSTSSSFTAVGKSTDW